MPRRALRRVAQRALVAAFAVTSEPPWASWRRVTSPICTDDRQRWRSLAASILSEDFAASFTGTRQYWSCSNYGTCCTSSSPGSSRILHCFTAVTAGGAGLDCPVRCIQVVADRCYLVSGVAGPDRQESSFARRRSSCSLRKMIPAATVDKHGIGADSELICAICISLQSAHCHIFAEITGSDRIRATGQQQCWPSMPTASGESPRDRKERALTIRCSSRRNTAIKGSPTYSRHFRKTLKLRLGRVVTPHSPPAAITPLHPESPAGAPPVPDRSEPLAIPQKDKKPRSGSISSFGSFGSFGSLQLAGSTKRKNKMHSPQVARSASGRRGSLGLASGATAEDSCLFVDNLIRGVQLRLRTELNFCEVVVSTGEEAVASDTDSGRSRTLLAGSILNDNESPSKDAEQPWEAIAASKRQLLYGKDVDRKNSDASHCSDCAKGTVYVSDGYENKQRLLVIVPYREAGIWSRSICMNQFDSDSDSGSMMSYLKKALSENYGVVIMNPAAQSCHPRSHVESAWDQLIAPLLNEVFIVAFSRGAQMVLHLLNYDNGLGVMQDRVKALALVEPSHYVSDSDTYFARRMLARRAVSWILNSEIDVGSKIPQGRTRHGCVCVSAGTVPSNVLGSSGAYALEMVKSSVFGSFAARCGEAAGITVNASKINACGICHRKLSMLNRRIPCSWCEVKYCSRCCEDKFVPAFGSWRVCSLCQSLPCLIDPRHKNRSATNHTSPTAAAQERCSVFIRPTADDDDPVCLGDFEIVKLVGRGACGRVKLVRKKHGYDEGVFYAMKAIRKKLVIQRGLVEATNAERRILDRIKHPYVATLCYAFQTEAKLYLLSKYYPGGNLLDQMRLARRFTEDRTRLYTAEVALAIRHLHQNDIIYRDLKLENVLVDSDGHVALTDFGMSKENMPDEGRTTTFVGTYQMMAPEVFSGKSYSRAVDWWALGVMVYEMIDGRTPFNAKTNRLIKERIVNVDLKFSPRFTEDAKDFVSKLLTKNEDDRLGSGEHGFEHIKHHPWFKGLDWDSVERKEALFEGQYALMEKHAKEYRTEDIFETYMNTVDVPIDTPASVKSSNDELFNDFAFNYMDGPDEEQRDIPEPDEEGDGENLLSPMSPSDSTSERTSKPRPLTLKEDKMLDTFLSTNGSHFDLTLLRPNQATDFGMSSACSSLSSEGTDDEAAEPVERLDDLEPTKEEKEDSVTDEKKKPSSPTTQPASPTSNDGTDVDSELTKIGSNSTDATTEMEAAKAS